MIVVEDVCEGGDGSERCHRYVEGVVTQFTAGEAGLVFCELFVVRTIDFRQKIQRDLEEGHDDESEPERGGTKGLAEVIGEAGAKGVGEDGEEESEGVEEFGQFTIYDFGFRMTMSCLILA